MKTILVPVDLSPVSIAAVEVAAQLARPTNATVVLLHLIDFPQMAYTVVESAYYVKKDYSRTLIKDARLHLQDIVERPDFADITFKVKIEIREGSLADNVVRRRADLIVMGSTGAKGWKELTKGSNAEHVIRNAKRPVLIVKGAVDTFVPQKVLFATDLNETDFIAKGLKMFHKQTIDPYFVYVDNGMYRFDADELRAKMAALAKKLKLDHYTFTIYNDATHERGIIDYAHEIEADLIVMHTHARKGLEHLLLGSVTEDVVNHADIPVMSV